MKLAKSVAVKGEDGKVARKVRVTLKRTPGKGLSLNFRCWQLTETGKLPESRITADKLTEDEAKRFAQAATSHYGVKLTPVVTAMIEQSAKGVLTEQVAALSDEQRIQVMELLKQLVQ
jgi:hypothetical protein